MTGRSIAAITTAFWLTATANAGFYDVPQPISPLVTDSGIEPLPAAELLDAVSVLRNLGNSTQPNPNRQKLITQRDQLKAKGVQALTASELAELGRLQWRLREQEAAAGTLQQAVTKDPRNYWALTHFGSVLQARNELGEASNKLEVAGDYFPDPWPVAPKSLSDWFKKAERYQFKLLRLRMAEGGGRTSARPAPVLDVDNIFGARFIGPSGKYEPGVIADEERKKIPDDAIAIVQQLLLWFPDDARLMWLLGELYAADGKLESAFKILDHCVWSRNFESPTLREHRRMVHEAYEAKVKAAARAPTAAADESGHPQLLPDRWQLWAVGSAFGLVLLILGYFQFRELFRRVR